MKSRKSKNIKTIFVRKSNNRKQFPNNEIQMCRRSHCLCHLEEMKIDLVKLQKKDAERMGLRRRTEYHGEIMRVSKTKQYCHRARLGIYEKTNLKRDCSCEEDVGEGF